MSNVLTLKGALMQHLESVEEARIQVELILANTEQS